MKKKAAIGSALALCAGIAIPGIASAAPPLTNQLTFAAVDNGNCTATFTVTNKTNVDTNRVVYWTGPLAPGIAPPFEDDRHAEIALFANPAVKDANGDSVEAFSKGGGYREALESVTTEETIDFSSVADGSDPLRVTYRMTGVERDAYDQKLLKMNVTGCVGDDAGNDDDGDNDGDDTSTTGSFSSLDIFGSLGSLLS